MGWLQIMIRGALITTLSCATLLACDSRPAEDPLLRAPLILSEGADLNRFLEQAARLVGTPIAARAHETQNLAADCDLVIAQFGPPKQNSEESSFDTRCIDSDDPSPLVALATKRKGDHDGVIFWPVGRDGRLEIRFSVDVLGGVIAKGVLIPPTNVGLLRLLIPDIESPDTPVLNLERALIRAQARPAGGLGLAELVPSGGQADRMFALRGRLLEGALLSGTWEIGLLPPVEGGENPLPIGALHHRGDVAIAAALGDTLDRLEATWPIKRSPRPFPLANGTTLKGGCFLELPLLPELAPCWVVHPDALIVGWRGDAIDAALAPPAVSASGSASPLRPEAPARFDVYFDRIADTDRMPFGEEETVGLGQVFERLSLRVAPEMSGEVAFSLELPRRAQ